MLVRVSKTSRPPRVEKVALEAERVGGFTEAIHPNKIKLPVSSINLTPSIHDTKNVTCVLKYLNAPPGRVLPYQILALAYIFSVDKITNLVFSIISYIYTGTCLSILNCVRLGLFRRVNLGLI